jgi:ribosomal protein S18 acetylase RimI-like enzyme
MGDYVTLEGARPPRGVGRDAALEGVNVIGTPRVELATTADLEGLAELRLAQGWRGNRGLLRALLEWEDARIFVMRDEAGAEEAGGLIASTAALAGGAVSVIGNVIVREDRQRRGLGRQVMEAALAWLKERGVRSVYLDATVEGRPLYIKLGFAAYGLSWFGDVPVAEVRRTALRKHAQGVRTALWPVAELGRLAALDAAAFGGDRLGLIARVLRQAHTALYVTEDQTGEPIGYALARPLEEPSIGLYVGPWVARDARAAAAALEAALDASAPWRTAVGGATDTDLALHVSLPGTSGDAIELCKALGLRLYEDDLLMRLNLQHGGPAATAEHAEWVYGWLAPMVF